ncbi:uncharacterized protein LOC124371922 [Homalodisca vitripennis]|uniref:uncharacterized protein LOC124371922 n=1 Tax=Homalodisca vitripennis TaxID=197043 RepID=UPI001EEB4960|nr:uncharacterized protein LOC124371922 [Homalodisca vitripennis]
MGMQPLNRYDRNRKPNRLNVNSDLESDRLFLGPFVRPRFKVLLAASTRHPVNESSVEHSCSSSSNNGVLLLWVFTLYRCKSNWMVQYVWCFSVSADHVGRLGDNHTIRRASRDLI